MLSSNFTKPRKQPSALRQLDLYATVTLRSRDCSAFFLDLPLKSTWRPQLVQNAPACEFLGDRGVTHITPVLYWLLVRYQDQCKVLSHIKPCLTSNSPVFSCDSSAYLIRAFCRYHSAFFAASTLLNSLLEEFTRFLTCLTFCKLCKMQFFSRAFLQRAILFQNHSGMCFTGGGRLWFMPMCIAVHWKYYPVVSIAFTAVTFHIMLNMPCSFDFNRPGPSTTCWVPSRISCINLYSAYLDVSVTDILLCNQL